MAKVIKFKDKKNDNSILNQNDLVMIFNSIINETGDTFSFEDWKNLNYNEVVVIECDECGNDEDVFSHNYKIICNDCFEGED